MLKVVHKKTEAKDKVKTLAEYLRTKWERKKSKNDVERFLQKKSVKAN